MMRSGQASASACFQAGGGLASFQTHPGPQPQLCPSPQHCSAVPDCPVPASSSSSQAAAPNLHHSLLLLSRWPASCDLGRRSHWLALLAPLLPPALASIQDPFLPLALCPRQRWLLSPSASSCSPAPYLTAPPPSALAFIFFYYKAFILERGDVGFVYVSHWI